jgi:hypothetical protein
MMIQSFSGPSYPSSTHEQVLRGEDGTVETTRSYRCRGIKRDQYIGSMLSSVSTR